MANKTIKMAAVAASVVASLATAGANAATISADASRTVAVEGSTRTGGLNIAMVGAGAKSASEAITVTSASGYADNDIMTFTLTGGTFVNPTNFRLYQSQSAVADGVSVSSTLLGGNAANVVAFRLASGAIGTGTRFFLGASSSADVVPQVNVADIASGGVVTLAYSVTSGFGQSIDSGTAVTLFSGVREFFATDSNFDNTVSLTQGRKNFGSATALTDTGSFNVTQTAATLGATTLDANDKFDVTLTGDLTGVTGVTVDGNALTKSGSTFSGSVVATGGVASGAINVIATVDGTTELPGTSWDLGVVLNTSDEDDQTLLGATNDFGSWTVNKLNAIVSSMSLNTTGFVSWLKVVNESTVDSTITGTATYTLTASDGTKTNGQTASGTTFSLGTASAGSVLTVSEATILSAIGMGSSTGALDVSLNINVDAPSDQVHVVAEKKASDGARTLTPVYYGSTRNLKQ